MKVIDIKEEEFNDKIKGNKVLVDCYANWCGPCKMLSPIIDEVASQIDNCEFYKLDIDNANNVAKQYGIMSIPTLLVFEKGSLVRQNVGFISKEELIKFIN